MGLPINCHKKNEAVKVDNRQTEISKMDYKMTINEITSLCTENVENGFKQNESEKDLVDIVLSDSPTIPATTPKKNETTTSHDEHIIPHTVTVSYDSVLDDALEATSCNTICLTVKQGDVCVNDELQTLMSNNNTSPLKATVASIVAKLVHPKWDTRKHQIQVGGDYSLRSIDTNHVSIKLFKLGLYSTATSFALTRSFEKAEPFNKSYTGKISPHASKDAFLNLVEIINTTASIEVLKTMLVVVIQFLKDRKAKHEELKTLIVPSSKELSLCDMSDTLERINNIAGSGLSVVPVISVHALLTVVQPYLWPSITVKPLKEHTAPDGHTKSCGDVEALDESNKPKIVIEVKKHIKVDETIVYTFNSKVVKSDICLKYILTTANTTKYYVQNNICVQTVIDFIMTYLQLTLFHNPSICTAFINQLQKGVVSDKNLSFVNKTAIMTVIKSLLA